MASFNPRTRTGCDTRVGITFSEAEEFQSTHPYRVRLKLGLHSFEERAFQSTHPYRVRPISKDHKDFIKSFNPRTRTGCDSAVLWGVAIFISFNPRTRTGCDNCARYARTHIDVSIHAPVQGATFAIKALHCRHRFQSTHPYRVRRTHTRCCTQG